MHAVEEARAKISSGVVVEAPLVLVVEGAETPDVGALQLCCLAKLLISGERPLATVAGCCCLLPCAAASACCWLPVLTAVARCCRSLPSLAPVAHCCCSLLSLPAVVGCCCMLLLCAAVIGCCCWLPSQQGKEGHRGGIGKSKRAKQRQRVHRMRHRGQKKNADHAKAGKLAEGTGVDTLSLWCCSREKQGCWMSLRC